MILICTRLDELGESTPNQTGSVVADIWTKSGQRQGLVLGHCRRAGVNHHGTVKSADRRRKMIEDTEQYLCDPHSQPWPRWNGTPSCRGN